ncbi:MAG: hypothetical protein GX552_01390 [Chloroflexi bacterium]|nr:hypothetical protein [Chloroflexota bacterium]
MTPDNPTHPSPQLDASGRAVLARHLDWWQLQGPLYAEVPHTPLGDLWLPLADGTVATHDMDVTPDMLDLDRMAGPALEPGPLEFYGDHIRLEAPYARVPWVEAILGCPIHATIQGGSMRPLAFVRTWDDWAAATPWRQNWFDALMRLTDMLAARSGGRYAVAQTLMRGPSDLAEAALGPELMCLSMYDHPRELTSFLETVTDLFIRVLRAQLERIPPVEQGVVNPFGVWSPGTVVRTQCDASSFLSPRQYAEWFLPYDARICEAVDYSVIHLHSGSLHTVDALLQVERPHAIQVTIDPEPSGPPVVSLIPTFAKILERKPLIIDGPMSPEEVEALQAQLPAAGRYLSVRMGKW